MLYYCIKPAWCIHIRLAMHLPLESNCYVSPWVVNKKPRKWFIARVLEAWYHCGAFKPDSTATLFQTLKTYYESISTGTETIQEVQFITINWLAVSVCVSKPVQASHVWFWFSLWLVENAVWYENIQPVKYLFHHPKPKKRKLFQLPFLLSQNEGKFKSLIWTWFLFLILLHIKLKK